MRIYLLFEMNILAINSPDVKLQFLPTAIFPTDTKLNLTLLMFDYYIYSPFTCDSITNK